MLDAQGGRPPRIYVDLPGTALGASLPRALAGAGPVVRVRAGQQDPTTVRVVVDLARPARFTLRRTARAVAIVVGPAPAGPGRSAPSTAAIAGLFAAGQAMAAESPPRATAATPASVPAPPRHGGVLPAFLAGGGALIAAAALHRRRAAGRRRQGGIFPLEPFLVNLADPEASRQLRITVALGTVRHAWGLPRSVAVVRDALLALLSSKTSAEVRTPSGKEALRAQIVERVNGVLGRSVAVAAYFSDFVVLD
ncbi:MAG TPA: flagellar basal body-associated FliL family protein [Candidatus Binatia bacterium]|nr:flagellar basal body-associated FliL family protein [Candidatus Binatia bacterium]